MTDLRICRVCLRTEAKVYRLDQFQLKSYYEEVMAVPVNDNDSLPRYICYECATLLHKFHKFKEKCYCGQKALKEILWKGPLTYESIYKLDKGVYNLQSPLELMVITERMKSYTLKDTDCENMPLEEQDATGAIDENNANIPNNLEVNSTEGPVPVTVFVDVKREGVKTEIFNVKQERKRDKELRTEQELMKHPSVSRRTRFLDARNWKKYLLSEEEALKEFRARCEDPKYVRAAYKCTDCFKGFSKEEMLKRHVLLRHDESLGPFECRVCRGRFRWSSHRRLHARQHYARYRCLRCRFTCALENSALLHEEYHSGVTRKCLHCGEEFRHASTYYSHVRARHRSRHVCARCGAAFVSRAGLVQHQRLKHRANDSPEEDDDAENTYCSRCEIKFDNRRAFTEHLFHSALHADGLEDQIQDDITIPSKVLGKRLRDKITKELRKRNGEEDEFLPIESKRKKRVKRKRRKPTTCHQCGRWFGTQAACRRHHVAAHPRTSFYAPQQRHVCELCGASLAPGSVAVHQNMHTREKVHPCETCGKQFHSAVGLKRHIVTHTGEKPFSCSLCDKRFTQSNSMKLHYRTFHLKQPYPKRNRRKKKEQQETEVETSEESSGTLEKAQTGTEPAPRIAQHLHDDSVHYLTLD